VAEALLQADCLLGTGNDDDRGSHFVIALGKREARSRRLSRAAKQLIDGDLLTFIERFRTSAQSKSVIETTISVAV
jgi:hypothetical protein